jgi:hypothetical protein
MPLTLYSHPFSSYCQKVLIAFSLPCPHRPDRARAKRCATLCHMARNNLDCTNEVRAETQILLSKLACPIRASHVADGCCGIGAENEFKD